MHGLDLQQQTVALQFSQNQLVGVESIPSVVFAPSKYECNQWLGQAILPSLRLVYVSTLGCVVLFGRVRDGHHRRRNGPREEVRHRRGVTSLDIQQLGHKPPLLRVCDLGQLNQGRPNLGGLLPPEDAVLYHLHEHSL